MHINLLKEFRRKRELLPAHLGKIIDVGSLDVNGTIKSLLEVSEYESYLGIDMREGRGVDIVMNSHDLSNKFDKNYFDTVFCMNTLEHDDMFWVTINEIKHVLKSGGHMVFAVPTFFFPEHSYPDDFWRMSESAVKNIVFDGYELLHMRKVYCCIGGKIKCDKCNQGIYNYIIYAVGRKI